MSSFAALNGALTGLHAQQLGLEVTGQNIANVNTPGYTRQRVGLQAIEGSGPVSVHSASTAAAAVRSSGVEVSDIQRLGDVFLETRVRTQTASASYLTAVAEGWAQLETSIAEPGENGLAAQMDTFFTAWADVGNNPHDAAAKAVLLENAHTLANQVADAYGAVESQWDAARARADALVTEVTTTAAKVADLNARIREITVSGGTPNDLADQRGLLLDELAALVGGETRYREDGTADVMVGGNALVRGTTSYAVAVEGTREFRDMEGTNVPAGDGPESGAPRLVWASSGSLVGATGGELPGTLAFLAPADEGGTGGPLAETGATYNQLAQRLLEEVNAAYSGATWAKDEPIPTPTDPRAFFALSATGAPTALSLTLAPGVTVANLITGYESGESYDGSLADFVSQLSGGRGLWRETVVDVGVKVASAVARAEAAELTRAGAEGRLLSRTGVNLDEESVNLVMYQRAYEAAARVITVIDEALDTLINRTGVVGR